MVLKISFSVAILLIGTNVLTGSRSSSRLYSGTISFQHSFNNIFQFQQNYELANYFDNMSMYSSYKNINNIITSLNHGFGFLFNQIDFIKPLWYSVLKNTPLYHLELRMNFKQISYLTTLLAKIRTKKKN